MYTILLYNVTPLFCCHGPISIFEDLAPFLTCRIEHGRGQRVDKKGYSRTW